MKKTADRIIKFSDRMAELSAFGVWALINALVTVAASFAGPSGPVCVRLWLALQASLFLGYIANLGIRYIDKLPVGMTLFAAIQVLFITGLAFWAFLTLPFPAFVIVGISSCCVLALLAIEAQTTVDMVRCSGMMRAFSLIQPSQQKF